MRFDLRLGTIPELRELSWRERYRLWRKVCFQVLYTTRFFSAIAAFAIVSWSVSFLLESLGGAKDSFYWFIRFTVFIFSYWIAAAWVFDPVWQKLIEEARKERSRITNEGSGGKAASE